jgi:anti-sigma B factor antagonist
MTPSLYFAASNLPCFVSHFVRRREENKRIDNKYPRLLEANEMNLLLQEHAIQVYVITLNERLDPFSAPELRQHIEELLHKGANRFVIDLSCVPFFDSAAMAVFVSALKRARQAGGDVKLVWPREEAARRIIHLTKFDRVFDLADTADEARQAFGVA